MSDKTAANASRHGNGFIERPEDPRFILITDKNDPYYDARITQELDEDYMLSLFREGQKNPAEVVKDGPNWKIRDGRQRYRHELWGNELIRQNDPRMAFRAGIEIKLWFTVKSEAATPAETVKSMFASNLSNDDLPSVRMRRVEHAIKFGVTLEEIRGLYKFATVQSVQNILDLADCSAKVLAKVDSGEMPQALAREMAKLPRTDQDNALKEMEASGALKGTAGTVALAAVKEGRSVSGATAVKTKKLLSRSFILRFLKELEEETSKTDEAVKAVVMRLLGEKSALSDESFKKYQDAMKRALKK